MLNERFKGYWRRWAPPAHAAIAVVLVLGATEARAQVANANVVEFLPSADHARTLASGKPAVTRYQLEFYQKGSLDSVLSLPIGKPAPQADGMIRVDFAKLLQVAPLPNVASELRVAAIGPDAVGVSTPSNSFVHECAYAVTPGSASFSANGGVAAATVTVSPKCPWSAATGASWVTLSTSGGVSSGSVSIRAAANSLTTARTAIVTVQDTDIRVTQSGANGPGGEDETVRYLGDHPWTSMTNGWGPVERNRSNGETGATDGRPITLGGRTYSKGLGVHALSQVRFATEGRCSTFLSDIGVDDEVGDLGSVVFQVWGDGTRLYDSGLLRGNSSTRSVDVDITGRLEVVLTVTAEGDGDGSDHADWADARMLCTDTGAPAPITTFVSDGAWTTLSNGWGPVEKDRSNGENNASDGGPLTLGGAVYAKGLGVHAGSEVRYPLNARCSSFQADIGVDDETGSGGSVVFQVWADGTKLFDSGTMTATTATRTVNVDVSGKNSLGLILTDAGNGNAYDHGDWANARVTCAAASSSMEAR